MSFEELISTRDTEIHTLREEIRKLSSTIIGLEEQCRLNEDIQD